MKKTVCFFVMIMMGISFSGCSDNQVDVNVDIQIDRYELQSVDVEENTAFDDIILFDDDNAYAYVKGEDIHIDKQFQITHVVEVVSPYLSFPYEKETITKNLGIYTDMIQSLFHELGALDNALGNPGISTTRLGPSAMLEIHMTDGESNFIISFFLRTDETSIYTIRVEYFDAEENHYSRYFDNEYTEIQAMAYDSLS